jgi:hypothetical protein
MSFRALNFCGDCAALILPFFLCLPCFCYGLRKIKGYGIGMASIGVTSTYNFVYMRQIVETWKGHTYTHTQHTVKIVIS